MGHVLAAHLGLLGMEEKDAAVARARAADQAARGAMALRSGRRVESP
ncbi:hypothetical protein [Streptomyces sp. NPDC058308]